MSLHCDTCLIRQPDLIAAEMDGDLVMMSIEQGEYYGLSGVAPRVWALLEQPISVTEIAAVIEREFEVEGDACRQDMLRFADDLLSRGLVQVR